MRVLLTILSFLLCSSSAFAQDDSAAIAAQSAQQAIQQSEQAMRDAQQAAAQAMQQASEANQRAMDAANQAVIDNSTNNNSPQVVYGFTLPPKFSVKPGKYSAPTTVRITDSTRGAIIYYTTDGWTPTAASTRYKGPIVIDSTTTLTAIAIAPYSVRSAATTAQYIIAGNATAPSMLPEAPVSAIAVTTRDGKPVLSQGTPVRLSFAESVSSKTATVGDKVPLALAEAIKLGDSVVAKKGTPATGTVIQVDRTGAAGAPGTLTVEVDSLLTEIGAVRLSGSPTKEGEVRPPNAGVLIPVVGPLFILKHGTDAVIPPGATFTAVAAADVLAARAD